jgi:hypothetical protein
MQNYPQISGPQQSLFLLAGTVVGVVFTLVIITQLPIDQAAVASSLGLSSLIVACAHISKPIYWWIGVGAIAGMIIGLGGIMAEHLAAEKEPIDLHLRLIVVVGQALGGGTAIATSPLHKESLPWKCNKSAIAATPFSTKKIGCVMPTRG